MGKDGYTQRRFPCIGVPESYKKYKPNKYDVLWPNNIEQVLGPNVLLWWLPLYQPDMKGKGLFFPQLPRISSPGTDLGIMQKDGKIKNKDGTLADIDIK